MITPVFAHGATDGLFVGMAGLVGAAALISRRRMEPAGRVRLLPALVAAAIGFQLFHTTEHMAQVGYWLAQPAAPPWLSPWAEVGVEVLARLTDGRHGTGAELLHLFGNAIFLAGLAAALRLAASQHRPGRRLLRVALWVQAAHVGEHLLLTTTWLAVGRTLGLSTAFGALAANPTAAVAARVWVHLSINLVGIVLALAGVQQTWLAPPATTEGPPHPKPLRVSGSMSRRKTGGECPPQGSPVDGCAPRHPPYGRADPLQHPVGLWGGQAIGGHGTAGLGRRLRRRGSVASRTVGSAA